MKNRFSIIAVLILAFTTMAYSESRTITGKVTDISGRPLAGVLITIKGSGDRSIVCSTDSNGNYRIIAGNQDKTLVFKLAGYISSEELIGNRSVINIKMSQETVRYDEAAPAERSKKEMAVKSASMASPMALSSYGSGNPVHGYYGNSNTEGYASVGENGYKMVKSNPLSTFSIDVDNASYSNIRRFINMGEIPPAEAVRIEEMINYFKYDYPRPAGKDPFSVSSELAVCPWNKSHWILQVGLRGRSIDKSALPPSNLVFLIDVSGSMNSPNKLPLLKSSLTLLVNELRPVDHVAIVVYAGAAGVVLESTPGNRKEAILEAIDHLQAGGSTAGGAGLRLAYDIAGRNFVTGGNNRIILATDGDFNVGESGNGAMERLVEEKRRDGVFITVLGFGMGNVKDDKMELIADKGNGNYSYIDNLQEARRVLVREFGGTLFTLAKDVKFQIEFNPQKVDSYRLIGYENRLLAEEDFNDDNKDAGEMGSGHNVTALYELIPAGSVETRPLVDPLKYQAAPEGNMDRSDFTDEFLTIKVRYKKPDGITSLLMVRPFTGPVSSINGASDNLRFAAAVAEFGMILRNSEYRGYASLDESAALARSARGEDEEGYRAELIRLIKTVRDMKVLSDKE